MPTYYTIQDIDTDWNEFLGPCNCGYRPESKADWKIHLFNSCPEFRNSYRQVVDWKSNLLYLTRDLKKVRCESVDLWKFFPVYAGGVNLNIDGFLGSGVCEVGHPNDIVAQSEGGFAFVPLSLKNQIYDTTHHCLYLFDANESVDFMGNGEFVLPWKEEGF